MGFENVEPPSPAHRCAVPDYREYGPGTVWVCDVCLTRYTRMKESFFRSETGKHAQTNMWEGRPATDLRAQRIRDQREAEKARKREEKKGRRG